MSRRDALAPALIAAAVDAALGVSGHTVAGWSEEIYKGEWDAGGGIAARLFGTATHASGAVPFAIVFKVPNQVGPNGIYREREALLYGSALPAEFPDLFAAPRLYHAAKRGDETWLFMEEIDGLHGREWPVAEIVRCARLFGELQGRLSQPQFQDLVPGLIDDNEWYRRRYAHVVGEARSAIDEARADRDGSAFLATEDGLRLVEIIKHHDTYLTIASRLPRSLCHGDFNFMNLRLRPVDGGPSANAAQTPQRTAEESRQIVAIDWQYAGFRPIGADVSGLIADSSAFGRRNLPAVKLLDDALPAYCEGLAAGGMTDARAIGRIAVLSHLLGHWALITAYGLRSAVRAEPDSEARTERFARIATQCELIVRRAQPEHSLLLRERPELAV